jgi:N-acetylated-alpha-linked acidic dipeptidase
MTLTHSRPVLALSGAICLLALAVPTLQAQTLTGFTRGLAGREQSLERLLATLGDTSRARSDSRALARSPHVAGTPAQQTTARFVLQQMRGYGLDTSRTDYQVYIPYPESTVVEIVSPTPMRLALNEPPLAQDTASQGAVWPVMNGHAAPGDVTAPVVYVNYGLVEDYRVLDSLGVSVRGKIAIARYGRSFRGIKAREAEAHGARALLLYSDPEDDGYVKGDVYPEGPMRPATGVQRGSILNISGGDPASPGWAATAGARRLPLDSMDLPRIPVVPIGYGNAALLLRPLRGTPIPGGWQGGLPFRYHIGGDEVVARVALWQEPPARSWKTITNTFGTIRGSEWPDEMVLVGGHRDAWGPGAMDNVSGVVSILEAARMMGEAARHGYRPRRTVVFATWDAEEWGLMGSSEWVESREPDLAAHMVAYLNLDVSAAGRNFGAEGTATLQPLLRELSRLVEAPYDSVPIYQAWRRSGRVADTADVRLGDLGGGSDFAGFYNHLGIPAAGFGFGGPSGIYHSAYDSYDWMARFGDPGFESHVAAGTLAALFLSRLANADIEPFDFPAYAAHLRATAASIPRLPRGQGPAPDLSPVLGAITRLDSAAARWEAARDRALGASPSKAILARANARVRQVEQALTRPEGLAGRPWMRNLVFASDRDNGYADVPFPTVVEAWRAGDPGLTGREVADLAARITAAASRLDEATAMIGSPPGR